MDNDQERDKGHTNSLVTEKDIDPTFGLFTEETREGAVSDASELLAKQHPRENAHVHESHIPAAIEAYDELDSEVDTAEEISEELAAVPDADVIAKDSPIDPASPGEEFHGTDLLNGVGNHPEDETEEL
ncbi:hypothetical protein [Paenibacillus sp. LHD-38]|uniref:hypothetical protein n=1 Tax=Paenibacillus sp. LHD-38 TaxID=3072143 RepID=UPI00280FC83F|nr:hypothetical protein [Paenibacillus sp. LHD-38]MDQ8734175.1 hypothetical protein [Paenibacillus sp. LHD-38]